MNDPHRPAYHFSPALNWMNDPTGLIYWEGKYHLFYQYNPNGAFWGTLHWGHAASPDLIHWEHLPLALAPTPGGPDQDGCFSGCVIANDGVPTMVYTGVYPEVQCLAAGSPDLLSWQKFSQNPVVAGAPQGLDLVGFRDPYVWNEDNAWYMLVGAGIRGVGGAVLLYRSADLVRWEYLRPLLVGEGQDRSPVWTGLMWECPKLFKSGEEWILIVSVTDGREPLYSIYFTGAFHDGRFLPQSVQKLDHGDRMFYAPTTIEDERKRRIMFGWIPEGRSEASQRSAGWAGILSLPRELRVEPDGWLRMTPLEEIRQLRREHLVARDLLVGEKGYTPPLDQSAGNVLEVLVEFIPGDARAFGLRVCASADDRERTLIYYDAERNSLIVDTAHSSLDSDSPGCVKECPVTVSPVETLKMNLFIDRSVIEVFANDRAAITARIYPTLPGSQGVTVFSRGNSVAVKSLHIWKLGSIW